MSQNLESWVVAGGTEVRRGRTTRTPASDPDPQPSLYPFRRGFHAGNPNGAGGGGSGGFDSDYATISATNYLGPPQVYRCFFSGAPDVPFAGSNADKGPPVVVSFKFDAQGVIAGTYDTALTNWFNSIPVDRMVWWSYYHEPEDQIEGKPNANPPVPPSWTAAQYRAAWSHIIDLSPVRDTLQPVVILMSYSLFAASRKNNIAQYITTNPRLHGLFWDSYLTGNTKNVDGVVTLTKSVSKSFGLAHGITETSVANGYNYTGMTHTQTMESFVAEVIPAAAAAPASEVLLWFESNKSDGDWRMRPYPNAMTTWRNYR